MNHKEQIKQLLTPKQVFTHYGVEFRGNRCKCPIHGGTDYNMAVNQSQGHCFVCGDSVDIFAFIMRRFTVTFPEALRILNDDFRIGLDLDAPIDKEVIARERERRLQEQKRREEYQEYKRNWLDGRRYEFQNFGLMTDSEPLSYERWCEILPVKTK